MVFLCAAEKMDLVASDTIIVSHLFALPTRGISILMNSISQVSNAITHKKMVKFYKFSAVTYTTGIQNHSKA
jgi:hypothetical protein